VPEVGAAGSARLLLVDNYDSFTWNLYQALAVLGVDVQVQRNDALTVDEVLDSAPDGIVLSPGPGHPRASGICPDLLERLPDDMPLLGVCLGHQALIESCGGALEQDPLPAHGKASPIFHDDPSFEGLPNPFMAGRYHSLRASASCLPDCLRLTAWTEDGRVMGVRHKELPRFGLQFHPESILTEKGGIILAGFLREAGLLAATQSPN
jgi:anthranilate synthase/aminodeoxychorismate synthase-like glutamine amidotransferase